MSISYPRSRRIRRTWSKLPLIGLLTVSCSTQMLSPDARLESELEELKTRVLELQRKAAVTEVEMARLRQQVASLEVAREAAGRRPEMVPSTEPSPEGPRAVKPPSTDPIEERNLAPVPVPASEGSQAVYDQGYTLYHQGRYVDAETTFLRFLDRYGASELADNAQYWIGECRYARRDYQGALAAFEETLLRHPDGNKVPDALLKAAQTLERLSQPAAARERYREVERRFPDTGAALTAAERLAQLERSDP